MYIPTNIILLLDFVDMESGEHVCIYPCDDDSDIRSFMVAEPNL